ncbi:hypothetical protein, partial [Halapricum sp. CBA1109]|uniref:hypothetical protein n=1 Tax=Halapricum sp. CBA1109 TaxID=2668068 RepID=UPI001E5E698D
MLISEVFPVLFSACVGAHADHLDTAQHRTATRGSAFGLPERSPFRVEGKPSLPAGRLRAAASGHSAAV